MVWKYRPRAAELHRFCPDVVDRVTSRAILCVALDLPQLIYVECRSLRVVCRAEWDQAFGSMMMFDTPLRVEAAVLQEWRSAVSGSSRGASASHCSVGRPKGLAFAVKLRERTALEYEFRPARADRHTAAVA
jgi:hypothetical protein